METKESSPFQTAVTHLKTQFSNYEQNRKTIQDKWDRNHRAFVREEGDEVWKKGEGEDWRSKTYIGKTREKVMAAAALVMDTILQGGKIPYAFKPSPWQPDGELTLDSDAAIQTEIAAMTALTDRQLVDTHADRQLMKHVISQALYGITWGKKIVHSVKRSGWRKETLTIDGIYDYSRIPGATQWRQWSTAEVQPGWAYVPCWDIFWDVESENVQESQGIFHRQIVSPYWLRQKVSRPFFLDANLKAAAKTASDQTQGNVGGTNDMTTVTPILRNVTARVNTLTYVEYWGRIPRAMAEAIEAGLSLYGYDEAPTLEGYDDAGDEVEVMACFCGDYLVRYTRNDPDNRPFAYAKCEDNLDEETPWGIADNCEPLQLVINGAMRAFEDNKKLAANIILAWKRRFIKNAPKALKPGAQLELAEECDDARKALQQVVIQDVGQTLVDLLKIAMPMLDDSSMVPRIAQGFTDPNVQTATEISVRQAQASKYIGMLVRNLDEGIIEQMVEYLYQYNMDDPDVQVGKGNYLVQALGFASYQNKVERVRKIQELIALALNAPILAQRTRFDYLFKELVKATDLDPDFVVMTQEESQPSPAEAEAQALQKAAAEAEIGANQAAAGLDQAKAELAGVQAARLMETPIPDQNNEPRTFDGNSGGGV